MSVELRDDPEYLSYGSNERTDNRSPESRNGTPREMSRWTKDGLVVHYFLSLAYSLILSLGLAPDWCVNWDQMTLFPVSDTCGPPSLVTYGRTSDRWSC